MCLKLAMKSEAYSWEINKKFYTDTFVRRIRHSRRWRWISSNTIENTFFYWCMRHIEYIVNYTSKLKENCKWWQEVKATGQNSWKREKFYLRKPHLSGLNVLTNKNSSYVAPHLPSHDKSWLILFYSCSFDMIDKTLFCFFHVLSITVFDYKLLILKHSILTSLEKFDDRVD